MNDRILIVDDDSDYCALLASMLKRLGYASRSTTSGHEALECARSGDCGTILTDLGMERMDGIKLCQALREAAPEVAIIVVTGDSTLESGVSALRAGAFDYLTKPVDPTSLGLSVARATRHVRLLAELKRLRQKESKVTHQEPSALLGSSAGMRSLRAMISRLAASDASVLIQGETGTGKELIARALHAASPRAGRPFVAINCASLPLSLLESELFGHVKGAFTDAKAQRAGLFLEASGGTLFLDEIGEMPLAMQSKLLRALQERQVRPVGGSSEVPFDVRLFCATHRDLEAEVAAGRFRSDLLYRINVVNLAAPPLRERADDVLYLASHFLTKFSRASRRPEVRLSLRVAEQLLAYDWPGNVRELENCMERVAAVAMFEEARVADLPEVIRGWRPLEGGQESVESVVPMDQVERRHILRVLDQLQGNKSRASELLGLDRRTLYRKLDQYRRDDAVSPPAMIAELA